MGYPQEDFYVSEFDSVNGWSSASPLVFNTRMNEGAMSVSSNGVLYVYIQLVIGQIVMEVVICILENTMFKRVGPKNII